MIDDMNDIENEINRIMKEYEMSTSIQERMAGKEVHIPQFEISNGAPFSKIIISNVINFKEIWIFLVRKDLIISATLDNDTKDSIMTRDCLKTKYIRIEYEEGMLDVFSYVGDVSKRFKFDESGWQLIA